MRQSNSWEATSSSAGQEFLFAVSNPKVYYSTYKTTPWTKASPVQALSSCLAFVLIISSIQIQYFQTDFRQVFCTKSYTYISFSPLFPHAVIIPSFLFWSLNFLIGNQEKFQTNSSLHNINTRNKHHLHRPVANLSCFQKGASYSGIRIFNSLLRSITNLKSEKTQFKVALKKFLNAHSFYSMDEFFTCTDDMYYWLYDCVNVSYTVIFLLFVCLWHLPHPIVLWLSRIYGMNICMYVCIV